jgi:hypothetical protein
MWRRCRTIAYVIGNREPLHPYFEPERSIWTNGSLCKIYKVPEKKYTVWYTKSTLQNKIYFTFHIQYWLSRVELKCVYRAVSVLGKCVRALEQTWLMEAKNLLGLTSELCNTSPWMRHQELTCNSVLQAGIHGTVRRYVVTAVNPRRHRP